MTVVATGATVTGVVGGEAALVRLGLLLLRLWTACASSDAAGTGSRVAGDGKRAAAPPEEPELAADMVGVAGGDADGE